MSDRALERRIGLVLAVATVAGMAVVAVGVAAMALAGIDPLARPYPAFDWGRLGPDALALRPEGLLWLGLFAVILAPAVRVGASLVGFAAGRDGRQAAIALVVLAIMLLGVFLGHGG
jgi:hypothetical protein